METCRLKMVFWVMTFWNTTIWPSFRFS